MAQIDFNNIRDLMDEVLLIRFTDLELQYHYCITILETAKRDKHIYAMAFAETYLGDYYIAIGNIVKSIEHLQKADIISAENGFEYLLKTIYNLLGICHESLHDEQTAIQYYLKAFQIVQNNPDQSVAAASILNNIASNFDQFDDFDESEKYFKKAHEASKLINRDDSNLNYVKLRIFMNFAETYRKMGRYDDMKMYLDLCDESVHKFDVPKKYLLACGYCGYYAKINDFETSKKHATYFLDLLASDPYDDQFLILEALYSICSTLIEIDDSLLAKKALVSYENIVHASKSDNLKQLQYLKILYHEKYEELNKYSDVYYEYYKIICHSEEIVKHVKSNGLKNILYLDEVKNALIAEQVNLENEAHLDEITQVFNRRYLNKISSKMAMDPNIKTIGYIMLDLDYFKEYNDTYGHCEGDTALQIVAGILKKHSTANIQVSRYGGDEFVCLCTNQNDDDLANYAISVQNDLLKANVEHNKSIHKVLSLSIGISNANKVDINNFMDVLGFADKALYDSKNKGRNTFSFYQNPDIWDYNLI